MRKLLTIVLFISTLKFVSQELFPNTDPASIVPARILGIRLMNEAYKEVDQYRIWQGAMFMYGINKKIMFTSTISFSNHHGLKLPDDFISNDGNIGDHTHGITKGNQYPYRYESIGLGFRYRFLNIDEHHRHLRMAAYGNGVYSNQVHDEAETNLMGDNTGVGGGIITTYLIKKLAISLTAGATVPRAYVDNATNVKLKYGNAYNYSLSFGYLLFPFKYSNYNQTNVNIYSEFMGKSYDGMNIYKDGKSILIDNVPSFEKGNYIDWRPAIQFIVKSNLRIDISGTFSLIRRSFVRTYPVCNVNVQYYFF